MREDVSDPRSGSEFETDDCSGRGPRIFQPELPKDEPMVTNLFSNLEPKPDDPILGISSAYRTDPRSEKVNLSVGMYLDDSGEVPLFRSVAEAEKRHVPVTTVVQNYNPRRTSVVLGEEEKVLYGKGFILDTLCGKTYALSPRSFYQINHDQTEVLYGLAVEAARLTGKEVVLDAYCGIGTIGLTASGRAKQVVGVELNRDAVRDAIGNARHNNVKNARFFAADATQWITEAAAAGQRADVIFMDPPREGSTPQFIESVARMAPKRVVYVSCNPETMARDLALLTAKGYRAEGFTPVDLFPQTAHCEVVCALVRGQTRVDSLQWSWDNRGR